MRTTTENDGSFLANNFPGSLLALPYGLGTVIRLLSYVKTGKVNYLEYDEIVDIVVTEVTERSFQQQRAEDEQLDRLVKWRVELSGQVEQVTAGLDAEARAFLTEYSEVVGKISERESKYIYLQGAKDCVQLLKRLDVI